MSGYQKYVDLLEKRKPVFLGLTALLMITAIIGIVRVHIITDFSIFMPTSSQQMEKIEQSAEIFGDGDQLILLIQSDGTPDDLRDIAAGISALADIEGVNSAAATIPDAILEEDDATLESQLELLNSSGSLPILSEREEGGYWMTGRISLEADASLVKTISALEDSLNYYDSDYLLSGEGYLEGKIFTYILKVLLFLPPAAIILLLLVFRLRIGSMRATILSMIPAILGGVLTLGSLSWVSGTISMMSALIPVFIIVLGSADGLHVTSHVIDRLKEGRSNQEAVSDTLEAVGIPIIMTSVTTMAGFLSLLMIDSPAIREMGAGAAWGILIAGVATWVVLPLILLHQKPLKVVEASKEGRVLKIIRKAQGAPSIIITLLIITAAIPGALRITSDFSMLSMYKDGTEVRQTIDTTASILGGALPVTVMYPAESPLDPAAQDAVEAFTARVEEAGLSSNGISIYRSVTAMLEMQRGMTSLPESQMVRNAILKSIERINPDIISNFYSEEGYARAMYFLVDLDNDTLQQFLDIAAEVSAQTGVELDPVGNAFAMKEMNDVIIIQQINSLILAVVLVMILTMITQKSIKLGLLSGLPIAITLLALFGFMGYAGIAMSVVSGIMMGMTVGVGIDYAIHYMSLYRYARRPGAPDDEKKSPAGTALNYVATPILANAMGLAIGFTAMNLSPFSIHTTLSLLMWVTMTLSAFLSLSLLPTLLGIGKEPGGNRQDSDVTSKQAKP